MTATDRAMASEEWARIEALGDRVTIDDALLGTLRDRIRELEAENERQSVALSRLHKAALRRIEVDPLRDAIGAEWVRDIAALGLAPASDEEDHS